MIVTLVNTNTVSRVRDPFTTGIPYMPVSLAYLAAALRRSGIDVRVVDAFGEAPRRGQLIDGFLVQGIGPQQVAMRIDRNSSAVFLYAGTVASHVATIAHVRAIRRAVDCPLVVMENTQAVTAYNLRPVAPEFLREGADIVFQGEGELRGPELAWALSQGKDWTSIPGLLYCKSGEVLSTGTPPQLDDLDSLPFPAWDLFPLEGYWRINYAHGPMEGPYLPLLTSRGCPYPCRFCIIPSVSDVRWRARSPANVVDEIEHQTSSFGVREFHIEDLNPTVNERRLREFCEELLRRRVEITWKIAAGTKIDTIKDSKVIELMARAGCRYLSLSPESGSPRVLKLMAKPFDHACAARLVKEMTRVGIRSQACFVIGFPGEKDSDRWLTRQYVRELVSAGLDEIALFIMTPVPGSATYGTLEGYRSLSELNFSPSWRPDYAKLSRFRFSLYVSFLWWKLLSRPALMLHQCLNFLRRRFETKMEMTPYRALQLTLLWMLLVLRKRKCGVGSGTG